MARSRFAVSAAQSVTTCPSTHDTMSALVSCSSGPTTIVSAAVAGAGYARVSVAGPRAHAHIAAQISAVPESLVMSRDHGRVECREPDRERPGGFPGAPCTL